MKISITAFIRIVVILTITCAFVGCEGENHRTAIDPESKLFNTISPEAFANPPLRARPGAYWCWLNGHVDHGQITREMEEAKVF